MTTQSNICPICEEGSLQHKVSENAVEYKGQSTRVELHYFLCDVCGSEQSDAAQLRTNKRVMMAFKKRVDRLLTGAEVCRLRERLGLTQREAAQVFGGGPVAFSKYENDDVAQSESMDKLLRLAAELPAAYELLARRAGVEKVIAESDWQDIQEWSVGLDSESKSRRPTLRVVSSSTLNEEKSYVA